MWPQPDLTATPPWSVRILYGEIAGKGCSQPGTDLPGLGDSTIRMLHTPGSANWRFHSEADMEKPRRSGVVSLRVALSLAEVSKDTKR